MSVKARQCKDLSLHALLLCALLSLARTQPTEKIPFPFDFSPEMIEDYDARMEAEEYEDDEEDSRSFFCVPFVRIFNVVVPHTLAAGERVAVVGDHERLGKWQVDSAVEMTMIERGHAMMWTAKVFICTNRRIHYRYIIYRVDASGRRRLQEWEGVPYARVLEKYHLYRSPGLDEFGRISPLHIADVERERGWLRYEYAIELKFIWQRHIRFYRYLHMAKYQQYFLKLSVFEKGLPGPESSLGDTDLTVSRFSYNQSEFRRQPRRGVLYASGDIVIFRIIEPLKIRHNYHLSIATTDGFKVGEVLIYSMDLHRSQGVLKLPINSIVNGFQVGHLTLPYIIVRPLQGAAEYNLRIGLHRYWPPNWPTLDVGHRGAGASFDSEAAFVENTIASYMSVLQNEGDMVELNVQLTRDYVPVIFHDFGFKTAPKWLDVEDEDDLTDVFIKDLTYNELKNSRVFMVNGAKIAEYTAYNVRDAKEKHRIFLTLQEAYEELPKALGLAVEVKWPQRMENDKMESNQSLNKNRFVDVILQVTVEHGCGRPLFFSSFDADICTMFRYKQNIFPVVFLTSGETTLWQPYKDLRTRSFLDAVNFVQSENLLGTAAHAEDFLQHHDLADLGLDLGQAVFLWGDDLNDAQVVQEFKDVRVSGLIYDRYEVYGPPRKRDSFFNATELLDLFKLQCVVVRHANCTTNAAPANVSQAGVCEAIVKRYS